MSRFTSYVHLYTVIVNVEKALINYKGELTVTFFFIHGQHQENPINPNRSLCLLWRQCKLL